MKIWTVWSGEYSDRRLLAVFSTYDKAEEFRKATAIFEGDRIDSEPIEHEVDKIPDSVSRFCINLDKDGNHVGGSDWSWQNEDVEVETEGMFHIKVNFSLNPDVMLKAARDKLTAYKAREAGI